MAAVSILLLEVYLIWTQAVECENCTIRLPRLYAERAFRLVYFEYTSLHTSTTLHCCKRNTSNMASFIITCIENDVIIAPHVLYSVYRSVWVFDFVAVLPATPCCCLNVTIVCDIDFIAWLRISAVLLPQHRRQNIAFSDKSLVVAAPSDFCF